MSGHSSSRPCLVTNFHCGPVIFLCPTKRDYRTGVSGLVFPSCRLYEVMNSITILSFYHQGISNPIVQNKKEGEMNVGGEKNVLEKNKTE